MIYPAVSQIQWEVLKLLRVMLLLFVDLCPKNEHLKQSEGDIEQTCQGGRMVSAQLACMCKDHYTRDVLSGACIRYCPLPGKCHILISEFLAWKCLNHNFLFLIVYY